MTKNDNLKYSDLELVEFRNLITSKIQLAQEQLETYTLAFTNSGSNDICDTSPSFDSEDGTEASNKEANAELAVRQKKFIRDLRSALGRIESGTYGICVRTGKKISRERLLLVPHTTMCVEAKESKAEKKLRRMR